MTNHPNRNWRRRAHDSAAAWLVRLGIPADGVGILAPEELREMLHRAYMAGFEAGRTRPPRHQEQAK